jgi:hypothetical protein
VPTFPVELKVTFEISALDARDAARKQDLIAEKLSALLARQNFASIAGAVSADDIAVTLVAADAPKPAPAPAVAPPPAPAPRPMAPAPTPMPASAVKQFAVAPRDPYESVASGEAGEKLSNAVRDLYAACDQVAEYSSVLLRAVPLPSALEAHVRQVERVARQALEKAREQAAVEA